MHADVFERNHDFFTHSVVIAFDLNDNSSSVNHSQQNLSPIFF